MKPAGLNSAAADCEAWIRALLKPQFTCELFLHGTPGRLRLDERWRSSQVVPDAYLFYFVAEGGFAAREEDRELRLTAGDLLCVRAGLPFHFRLPAGEKLLLYRFRLRPSRPLPKPAAKAQRHLLFRGAASCRPWVEQLVDEAARDAGSPWRSERVRGLLLCLFTELARLQSGDPAARPGCLTRAQQEALARFLQTHTRPWPTPASLAAHLRLSADYFTRVFTRTYTLPPRRWLVEQRVRLAAQRLLESRVNISEVADELGYESLFLFSRQFKAVLGVSPREYRKLRAAIGA